MVLRLVVLLAFIACTGLPSGVHGQSTRGSAVEQRSSPFDMSTPDPRVVQRFAGCFDVVVGSWVNSRMFDYDHPTPKRIVLDTTRARPAGRDPSLMARTPGFTLPHGDEQWSFWSPVGSDSLQVTAWEDGYTSVHFFMHAESDDRFAGVARYFTDVHIIDETRRWLWEQYPTAPVRLSRVACGR